MNWGPILLGAAGGWIVSGFFDKNPIVRGVIAATAAYAGNALASSSAAAAPSKVTVKTVATIPSGPPAGTSDTLSSQNLAPETGIDAGGGGVSFGEGP